MTASSERHSFILRACAIPLVKHSRCCFPYLKETASCVEAEFTYTELCFQLASIGQLLPAGWRTRAGGSSQWEKRGDLCLLFPYQPQTEPMHSISQCWQWAATILTSTSSPFLMNSWLQKQPQCQLFFTCLSKMIVRYFQEHSEGLSASTCWITWSLCITGIPFPFCIIVCSPPVNSLPSTTSLYTGYSSNSVTTAAYRDETIFLSEPSLLCWFFHAMITKPFPAHCSLWPAVHILSWHRSVGVFPTGLLRSPQKNWLCLQAVGTGDLIDQVRCSSWSWSFCFSLNPNNPSLITSSNLPGMSFSGDIQAPLDILLCSLLREPALAGGWTQWSPEVPSSTYSPIIMWCYE